MAGALVAISALPTSATILSTDILPFVKAGTTDRITAGNLRAQMFAFAATDPLNCGILTAVGNSTITGTLSGITTLTASSVVGNLTGNVSGSAATVTTAAQPAITSVGTLTALTVTGTVDAGAFVVSTTQLTSGALKTTGATELFFGTVGTTRWYVSGSAVAGTLACVADSTYNIGFSNATGRPNNCYLGGALYVQAAAAKIVPGVTSLSHRNNADNADNFILTDAGNATLRGTLTFATASMKIIPGATQLSFRDNADANDNLIIINAGSATFRAAVNVGTNLAFTAATAKILRGATSLSIRDNADTSDLMLFNSSGITLTNSLITTASLSGQSGLRIPHGTLPSSPVDGDMWTTTAGAFIRINGVTKTFTLT